MTGVNPSCVKIKEKYRLCRIMRASLYRIISSVVFMCHLKIVLVFITLGRFYLSEPILIISNQGDR